MSDADCTPGREPRSVAASKINNLNKFTTTLSLTTAIFTIFSVSRVWPSDHGSRRAGSLFITADFAAVLGQLYSHYDERIQRRIVLFNTKTLCLWVINAVFQRERTVRHGCSSRAAGAWSVVTRSRASWSQRTKSFMMFIPTTKTRPQHLPDSLLTVTFFTEKLHNRHSLFLKMDFVTILVLQSALCRLRTGLEWV